jgi:hypothetical protein
VGFSYWIVFDHNRGYGFPGKYVGCGGAAFTSMGTGFLFKIKIQQTPAN